MKHLPIIVAVAAVGAAVYFYTKKQERPRSAWDSLSEGIGTAIGSLGNWFGSSGDAEDPGAAGSPAGATNRTASSISRRYVDFATAAEVNAPGISSAAISPSLF